MNRLIRNALGTPDGTVLESLYIHDYNTHTDANGKIYMIDGGLEYSRCSNNGDETDMCMYDDQLHPVQREVLTWGTRGKEGDKPLTYKKIADMETDHLEAVLEECAPSLVRKNCMEEELRRRKNMKEELDKG